MRFWIPLLFILGLSAMASAASDVAGPFGSNNGLYGFTGRFPPLTGRIGAGSGGGCAGVIDASAGCPLPMLGM